ncbi:MAG: hypothetical protein JWQ37_2907, partial [Blastococcus sp.]|nr:hypothetical protein [Blastococcus sp.]
MIGTQTDRPLLTRTWWAVLFQVVAASLPVDFVLNLVHPADQATSIATRVVRFFSYFTTQSNLLVLATNMGEHYISPVLTVLGWLLFGPRPRIRSSCSRSGWS